MTRALTLTTLLCALAITVTACDRHPSPSSPPTPQTTKAEKAAAALAKAAAEFKCPSPSARFMIDDGTNRGPNQPVRTNCTTAYATCDAQSQAVFDHCPSGQVFDKRFSICVVKDACDEVRS
ncbi:putative lipoprotein transmembrane [Ralstonia insidiosa]|uniref:Lipoprotein transmembrane n=1 Tax=Ralstonia insidiosa TaxID=190721 RepID=A0AAC9FR53_9RALS|nr:MULTISPECIES: chitin-binding domain-containing protein [Ralstonia]ANH73507.1 putative lipoprotein transmembrane [Ralstonia insidiosa]EPX98081.1 chitin-binding protein [Ralstonia sp. AU12-08]MBY4704389.1 chitin-binding protein [Ralstonia insidiosa]GAQ30716.1 chitin-binding peritrophin-A [Ralstonia sp. NT80]